MNEKHSWWLYFFFSTSEEEMIEVDMLDFLEITPEQARVIRERRKKNRKAIREIEKKLNE
ncbi:hypothetical protein LCGC14_0267540 [marine sediment metagenome]|uniref:Uncharacterized protein n=1 Tax=marine sediment metagenome TaxID=412755 RepID=A0A0F9X4U7_9ZZZZ